MNAKYFMHWLRRVHIVLYNMYIVATIITIPNSFLHIIILYFVLFCIINKEFWEEVRSRVPETNEHVYRLLNADEAKENNFSIVANAVSVLYVCK